MTETDPNLPVASESNSRSTFVEEQKNVQDKWSDPQRISKLYDLDTVEKKGPPMVASFSKKKAKAFVKTFSTSVTENPLNNQLSGDFSKVKRQGSQGSARKPEKQPMKPKDDERDIFAAER